MGITKQQMIAWRTGFDMAKLSTPTTEHIILILQKFVQVAGFELDPSSPMSGPATFNFHNPEDRDVFYAFNNGVMGPFEQGRMEYAYSFDPETGRLMDAEAWGK